MTSTNQTEPQEFQGSPDRLLTVCEAADFLRLAPGTVFHLVSQKRLPVVRISSRCIRFSRNALLRWIESLTQLAEAERGLPALRAKGDRTNES